GTFARAALASDTEVVEDFPSRYDVAAKRQHRWTRGDWQLLPWIFSFDRGVNALPVLGRFKMLDNLRRSLLAPSTLLLLGLCWILPFAVAITATLIVILALALPIFLPSMFAILPHRTGVRVRSHLNNLFADVRVATQQLLLSLVFLADQSWQMGDAIVRTLWRLSVSRRHLLEWTTAAQSNASPRLNLQRFYQQMAGGCLLALVVVVAALLIAPTSWPLAVFFGVMWSLAPAVALWVSKPPKAIQLQPINAEDARLLRLTARRTWRFFETFV